MASFVSHPTTAGNPPTAEESQPPPVPDSQQPGVTGYPHTILADATTPQGHYVTLGYYAQPGGAVSPSAVPYAVAIDPATGIATPYVPAPKAGFPQPYVTPDGVVVTVVQPTYAAPPATHDQDPANRIETGRWAVGLCDCCNNCVPNLLMSWCCPCVALAQVYVRMGLSTYQAALTKFSVIVVGGIIVWFFLPARSQDTRGHWDANGNYVYERSQTSVGDVIINLLYIVIQLSFAFFVFNARVRVRQRFQLPGDTCGDCLVSTCCSCCAIAQMATHVKSYRPGDCSFSAPDTLPPYN